MKKALAILLTLCLLLGLTACGKKGGGSGKGFRPFEDEEEFLELVENTIWYSYDEDETYYRIRLFGTEGEDHYVIAYDLDTEEGEKYEDMFARMLTALQQEEYDVDYDDVADFLLDAQELFDIYTMYDDVEYDWEAGTVTDGDNLWDFSSGYNLESDKCFYYDDDELVIINSSFDVGYQQFKKGQKQVFLANYPNAVTAKDVRYDLYTNLGKNFILEGTVKLDDYFNYDYRNLDSIYFCMHVTPTGGSAYTDQWYIYASRSDFEDLKNLLMDKNLSDVTLICRADFVDAGKQRMATLVDIFQG